jgi:hypothetical protein
VRYLMMLSPIISKKFMKVKLILLKTINRSE